MLLHINDYNVIESKVVLICQEETEVWINLSDINNGFDGNLCLEFHTNKDRSPGIELKVINNNMHVVCYNFLDEFGRFTTSPVKLGIVDNKKIYIILWSAFSKGLRRIEYTILSER